MSKKKYYNTTLEDLLFKIWKIADEPKEEFHLEIDNDVEGKIIATIQFLILNVDDDVAELELDPKDNRFKLKTIYSDKLEELD